MKDRSRDLVIPGSLGLITALLHILTATDSYGVFRDEFYYVANGRHLGFGYVASHSWPCGSSRPWQRGSPSFWCARLPAP